MVECEHSGPDLLPQIMVVHVIKRPAGREVRSSDMRQIRLEEVVEHAWRQASRRPATVHADDAEPAEMLSATQLEEEIKRTARALRSRALRKITDDHRTAGARARLGNDHSQTPTATCGPPPRIAPVGPPRRCSSRRCVPVLRTTCGLERRSRPVTSVISPHYTLKRNVRPGICSGWQPLTVAV